MAAFMTNRGRPPARVQHLAAARVDSTGDFSRELAGSRPAAHAACHRRQFWLDVKPSPSERLDLCINRHEPIFLGNSFCRDTVELAPLAGPLIEAVRDGPVEPNSVGAHRLAWVRARARL